MTVQPKFDTATTVQFGKPEFKQILSQFKPQPQEEGEDPANLLILFAGGSDEQKQQAIGAITEASAYNMHQIDLTGLAGERRLETQGNLREVFDSNQEDASILCLNADGFFSAVNQAEYDAEEDTLTPIDYLFQRMANQKGIIILRLTQAAYLAKARASIDFDIVVGF